MITTQDWQDAKEEFGPDAFRWFFITCHDEIDGVGLNYQFEDNFQVDTCPEFEKIQFKPLPELLAHDVDVYGDNAYLMWECAGIGWVNCISNDDILNPDFYCRRKKSSALPFDIERAKAGDVVEVLTANGWKTCKLTINESDLIAVFDTGFSTINSLGELRMKYPPKAKKS